MCSTFTIRTCPRDLELRLPPAQRMRVVRNAFGFNRSYVYLGNRFSMDAWMKGQKAGQNFVTNGPMLFVRANGKLPGTTFPDSMRETEVELEALSPRKLDRIEIVVDGAVAANLRGDAGAI